MKKVWIFFPEMTLAQFPKSDFLNFRWIFFPKMTLAQFPVFGFFFQDSRIGVKCPRFFVGFRSESIPKKEGRFKGNFICENFLKLTE